MFLPRVPPTSDSGTCRTARSSTSDKSEALVVGTSNQLYVVDSSASSISIAGVDLPVAEDRKVLRVFLDRHLTLEKNISIVVLSCNYHAHAIRHISYLLSTELAHADVGM